MSNSISSLLHIKDPRVRRGAQIAWIVVVALNWIIFLAALPYCWRGEVVPTLYNTLPPMWAIHIFWIGQLLTGLFALTVSLFIFWRQGDNQVALVFSATISVAMLNFHLPSLAVAEQIDHGWWLPASFAFVITMCGSMLIILTFPNGQFDPPWTRTFFAGYVGWEITRALLRSYAHASQWIVFLTLTSAVLLLIGLGVLIWRYRIRLKPVERQQTKLVVLGITYILVGFAVSVLLTIFLNQFNISAVRRTTWNVLLTLILINGSAVIGIILIALAILRRGLWNIDVAVNRSLVYGGLAIIITVSFALVALIMNALVDNSNITLAVSVVAAGLLFNPAYKGSKLFVDLKLYGLNFELDQLVDAHAIPPITHPGAFTGLTISNYQVLDFIGRGGMGEVYKGYGKKQTVAIKFLPKEFATDTVMRQRFEREARVLRALEHPNILHIYDAGVSADGLYYLVIEYIDGCELQDYIKDQGGRLTVMQAVPIVNQIAAALDYLHSRGLFHRDIKPSNVMIRLNGTAILMDFGLVTGQSGEAALTGSAAIGTIMYMAPEQIQAGQIDHHTDIYALGVVVYQMLTGSLPFDGQLAQVLFAHLNQPAPDPRRIVPELPPGVSYVTGRALEKHPGNRFSSAGELARALADTLISTNS